MQCDDATIQAQFTLKKKKTLHKYRYTSLHAQVMFVFNSCEGHGFIRTTAFFAVTLYTYRWCRK